MAKKKEEFSVKEFDKWVDGEIDEVLKEIPEAHQRMAKTDKNMLGIIAERVARKKCFNVSRMKTLLQRKFDEKY